MSAINNVSIIGANGHLGPSILQALREAKVFNITAITRISSKSTYPSDVHTARISDSEPSFEELVSVLKGQDALVVSFSGTMQEMQIKLADAAVAAGVKRFIPADYGSCDSSSGRALELIPLYKKKKTVREHLQSLEGTGPLSWTSLICGHFFDYGLKSGLLGYNLEKHTAHVFDSGDVKWSATTLASIGHAVVKILQHEQETKNRLLYIYDFCVTQNEVLAVLKKLSAAGEKWNIQHITSQQFIKDTQARTEKDSDDAEAWEDLVSVVGIIDANWSSQKNLANTLLEMPKLDLEETIKSVLADV